MKENSQKVLKKVLKNGLTVLVRPTSQIPKVSVQLWYNVGSKDEKSNEKGIAHLIEHMIFKGTKELSESDINLITHKLSGYCNAFTSFDYTGYLFDFPSHHWQEALPIMADCMKNCTFKEEFLNSELKAVIQELKMYKDDYNSSLIESLVTAMFPGHPYQHPIIGYKQDLWNLKRENLINFYKKHYIPNNATLVVVGDVDPQQVFDLAEKSFGTIEPNFEYKKEEYNIVKDLSSTSVTLYRDVAQSSLIFAFLVPGAKQNQNYAISVISNLLAKGRGSRLYKKLVDELQLITYIDSFNYDLFDQGILFIHIIPKDIKNIDKIISIINDEITSIVKNGLSDNELKRATKRLETSYLSLLENNQKQAYVIGSNFLATGNENYIFDFLKENNSELSNKVKTLLNKYFHPSQMHIGKVVPMSEKDKEIWLDIQKISDQEDKRVLSGKTRELPVEQGIKVHNIQVQKSKDFQFPKPEILKLNNGLEVLYYDNKNLPKIDILLEFKANHFYDPDNLQGISNFLSNMLHEGTKNYTAAQLAHELESLGIKLQITSGHIMMSMLSSDLKKGLELLHEILTESIFEENSIEKVREQIISEIKDYWDEPTTFSNQLVRDHIYNEHHYKKNVLGTIESVKAISKENLIDHYKKFISPFSSKIVLVGDLKDYNVKALLNETLGKWQGEEIEDLKFKDLPVISNKQVDHYINRDQVVLCFAGLSISRKDPNYDKLLLFDQIFCGGVLGTMSSRLFQLREQSGLFYTIGGSLLTRSDHQPGMTFIKTIVSIDRLSEAEKLIEESIKSATKDINDFELDQAKNALINSIIDNFASNMQIANAFLFLRKYDFPNDFFDKRAKNIESINIPEIKNAVDKVLNLEKMIKLRVGRI